MEIDFNTNRVPKAEPSQPASRQDAPVPATDGTSFQATATLQDKLNNMSSVRPEQVERAKQLVSDAKYPPGYVLDRIAVLLAIHINQ